MFIFGWDGNCKILGSIGLSECDNCNNVSEWQIIESCKRATLYFVPVIKWNKKYLCVCSVCSYGYDLETREKAQDLLLKARESYEQGRIDRQNK